MLNNNLSKDAKSVLVSLQNSQYVLRTIEGIIKDCSFKIEETLGAFLELKEKGFIDFLVKKNKIFLFLTKPGRIYIAQNILLV